MELSERDTLAVRSRVESVAWNSSRRLVPATRERARACERGGRSRVKLAAKSPRFQCHKQWHLQRKARELNYLLCSAGTDFSRVG